MEPHADNSAGSVPGSPGPWSRIGQAVTIVVPLAILFAPTPSDLAPGAQRAAAVTALMAMLWLTQSLPLAVTALIPLVAFPFLGIQSAREVSGAYASPSTFLFFGGFIIALGIERWDLHRRLALLLVGAVGRSPRRIVLAYMLATVLLSMWISNTAAVLLMLPIVTALLAAIEQATGRPTDRAFDVALILGIAYCASIGGTMSLIGTPTNLAYVESFAARFPDGPEISAAQWLLVFVPLGTVFTLATWVLLTWPLGRRVTLPPADYFAGSLRALGPVTRGQVLMMSVVAATVLLWIFREPMSLGPWGTMPGWGEIVQRELITLGVGEKAAGKYLHDSTVALAMALLMFCLPGGRDQAGGLRMLMDWEQAEKLPWDVLLLIGGGFAIASGFEATGLSQWVGDRVAVLGLGQSPWIVVGVVCLAMTFLTEFTTNVATANVVLPILAGMAVSLKLDPRLIMLPAVISTSCGFMLPAGTPPNAIAFCTGRVRTREMFWHGLGLNLLGVVLITVSTFVILVPGLGIEVDKFPDWAAAPAESPPPPATTTPAASARPSADVTRP